MAGRRGEQMSIKYLGTDPEGHKLADRINRAFERGMEVATGNDPAKWPVCKSCGQPTRMVFADNGCCVTCDEEVRKACEH